MPERIPQPIAECPARKEPLKVPSPFLMPLPHNNIDYDGIDPSGAAAVEDVMTEQKDDDDEVVRVLPPVKENRKVLFAEEILVTEIEDRFFYQEIESDEDESYEIEIVEDDGDADFYLEIVDGEVFYVFETEDDISVDSDEESIEYEGEEILGASFPSLDTSSLQDLQDPSEQADSIGDDNDSLTDHKKKQQSDDPTHPPTVIDVDDNQEGTPEDEESSSDGQDNELMLAKPSDVLSAPSSRRPDRLVAPVRMPSSDSFPAYDSDEEEGKQTTQKTDVEEKPATQNESLLSGETSPAPEGKESLHAVAWTLAVTPPASPSRNTYGSPIRSPSKSILKANPPSPRKKTEPKPPKDPEKKKTKTFSKTYVKAEQFDGEHGVYSWKKPDWTTKQLKSTGKGEDIRRGANLASPITFYKKKVTKDPEWTQMQRPDIMDEGGNVDEDELLRRLAETPHYRKNRRKMRFSMIGSQIRRGVNLEKPITKATINRTEESINRVANQRVLRASTTGEKVREGKSLAAPVTIPLIKFDDTNHVANKNVLKKKGVAAEKKEYEWEKPAWAQRPKLKATRSGEQLLQFGDLQAPITHIRRHLSEPLDTEGSSGDTGAAVESQQRQKPQNKKYEWEKPSWTKQAARRSNSNDSPSLVSYDSIVEEKGNNEPKAEKDEAQVDEPKPSSIKISVEASSAIEDDAETSRKERLARLSKNRGLIG